LLVAVKSGLDFYGLAMRRDLGKEIENPRFDAAFRTLPGELQGARGSRSSVRVSAR